ncbi:MAG: GGDEF domain-containing protein, partial [Desulfobulbaceae bacterium]|nr:GGDEF domain-containing protein [Desulfobulbaceae bacterium]
DEFLIVTNEIHKSEDVAKIGNKIIKVLRNPFNIGKKEISIGVSIGISLYPDHGQDVDELVKKADTAMYSVKHAGKNNYAFSLLY